MGDTDFVGGDVYWDSLQAYHFDFHQARIMEGIDDSLAWKTPDHKLKQYLLVSCPTRNANSQDNTHAGSNYSTPSTEVCFKEFWERLSHQLQVPLPIH